jgi:uncharacterized low-complexity protein
MSKKIIHTTVGIVGAALVGSLAAVDLANAADNPFAAKSLDSGYMQLAEAESGKDMGEGKCGEGKCGSSMDTGEDKGAEGDSGAKGTKEDKGAEGKCGGAK